jgi:hypothetical protein
MPALCRGLSAEVIRQHARRLNWRRLPGNDGEMLILVPEETDIRPPEQRSAGQGEQRLDDFGQVLAALTRLLATEREDRAALRADLRAALAARERADVRADNAETRALQIEAEARRLLAIVDSFERERAELRDVATQAEYLAVEADERAQALEAVVRIHHARGLPARLWAALRGE